MIAERPINWRRAPDSALPRTDPHGRPLAELGAVELARVAGWCMTAPYHEAVRRARLDTIERTDVGVANRRARAMQD